MKTTEEDDNLSQLCPWSIDTLPCDGLYSHCCLQEGVAGDFGLIAEELEGKAAEVRQRRLDRNLERQKVWYKIQKATNVDAYRAAHNSMARNTYNKSPAKHVAAVVASRATSISTKKFYCEPCDLACRSDRDLKVHKKTKGHVKKTGEFDNTVNVKPAHARAVKNKSHHCKACDLVCRKAYELGNHNKTRAFSAKWLKSGASIRALCSTKAQHHYPGLAFYFAFLKRIISNGLSVCHVAETEI